jgi:hypothetical protein
MADDDKKSFWGSLPGMLTGLAAVLTAAGALIYHNHGKAKAKPKPEPAAIQQESTTQAGAAQPSTQATGSQPSPNPAAPPEGFQEQASYNGDCASPPAGSVCIGFRDGYQWLVKDEVKPKRKEVGSWEDHRVLEATGKQGLYQHVLNTNYVKVVAK